MTLLAIKSFIIILCNTVDAEHKRYLLTTMRPCEVQIASSWQIGAVGPLGEQACSQALPWAIHSSQKRRPVAGSLT